VIAELLGKRSEVAELHGTLPEMKERWNTTSLIRGRTALIAAQPSRCLLHLVNRTLEAAPNLALIEL
jgi:hypothetical protein